MVVVPPPPHIRIDGTDFLILMGQHILLKTFGAAFKSLLPGKQRPLQSEKQKHLHQNDSPQKKPPHFRRNPQTRNIRQLSGKNNRKGGEQHVHRSHRRGVSRPQIAPFMRQQKEQNQTDDPVCGGKQVPAPQSRASRRQTGKKQSRNCRPLPLLPKGLLVKKENEQNRRQPLQKPDRPERNPKRKRQKKKGNESCHDPSPPPLLDGSHSFDTVSV